MDKNSLFNKKNILFVEDDAIMRQETFNLLEIFFNQVFVAKDGVEGYEIYHNSQPDIILTDIKMPKMDGLELIEYIRKEDRKIPICILSSHSEKEILLKALNAGIDAFVLKPITLESLLEALTKAFERVGSTDLDICLYNNVYYNTSSHELFVANKTIKLGVKEQQLLHYFVQNKNQSISKEQIVNKIWPLDDISDSALKSLLYRLRKKIGKNIIISIQENSWKLIC